LDKLNGCLRREVSRQSATALVRGCVVCSKNTNVGGIRKGA